MKSFWIRGAVIGAVLLCGIGLALALRVPGRSAARAAGFERGPRPHFDHTPVIPEKFESPQAVTRACLSCHPRAAAEVMKTSHWRWLVDEVQVPGHPGAVRIGIGGINRWLELYPAPGCVAHRSPGARGAPEALQYEFAYSVGSRVPAAWPELPTSRRFQSPCEDGGGNGEARSDAHRGAVAWPSYPFTQRVKLKTKVAMKGGCG